MDSKLKKAKAALKKKTKEKGNTKELEDQIENLEQQLQQVAANESKARAAAKIAPDIQAELRDKVTKEHYTGVSVMWRPRGQEADADWY